MSRRNLPALVWAAVVAALVLHNAFLWLGKHLAPDTDILSLLPVEQRDPVLQQAFTHIIDAASQRLVVLIGAEDWGAAMRAADAYEAVLAQQSLLIQSASKANGTEIDGLNVFYAHRLGLLTAHQEADLKNRSAEYWADTALGRLYSPFAALKIGAWQDDPFALFAGWLQERAGESPVRPRDGRLSVSDGIRDYVFLPLTIKLPPLSLEAQQSIVPLIERARRAALQTIPNVEVLTAGVILYAASAAEQARREVGLIGIGSTVGIVLLTWSVFRSLKPIVWVMLSIAVGCVAAISITWLLFDRIHALTLVFGASLIGVAQDYGIYYLCNRLDGDRIDGRELFRRLLPALALALITTVIGYLALALTPFPGLRQMAFFSAIGLIFAFLTVAFWFPALVRSDVLRTGDLAGRYGMTLDRWPRLSVRPPVLIGAALVLILIAAGLFHLEANDDIRLLQNPPKELVAEQVKLGRLLDAPSPVQFYLVRGATAEAVLEREEALKSRLDPLVEKQTIGGYSALSSWTPSSQSRAARSALVEEKLLGERGALPLVARRIGEDRHWIDAVRERLRAAAVPIGLDDFLKSAPGEPLRHLWLGETGGHYASVVALRGVRYAALPQLRATADGLEGVAWVDRVGEISSVLGRYRRYMGWVVFFSYFAVYALVLPRYRLVAWRVLAPTAVASLAVLALLGATGQGLQLFHVLALMLLLGIGVDYGIFLHDPKRRRDSLAWLAVGISALSTLLSFGLLGLSRTPALQAFGFTMMIGIAAVWVLSPCFIRKRYDEPAQS